jgi:hypothetical protein
MGMAIAVQAVRGVVASDLRPTDALWQINVSRRTRSIDSPANLATRAAADPLNTDSRRTGSRPAALAGLQPAAARAGLRAALAAATLAAATLAAMPAAHAQNTPAAEQSATAPGATPGPSTSQAPSSVPAAAGATSSTTPRTPAGATTGQAPPAGQSSAGKSDPVCFKLTGHCVDSSKAPSKAAAAGTAKSASTGKKSLNLTAPDVRTVVPESQLQEPLPGTEQITETQEADTVSVKTEQGVPPDVPLGFGAIWWAVNHPSQAWRIVTPAE